MATDDDLRSALDRLGIKVPAADLPFLQRARRRQEELLAEWSQLVPPESEPALVFKAKTRI